MTEFTDIYTEVCEDEMNAAWQEKGHIPLYTASSSAKIVIIGQAPGVRAQESKIPWADASGIALRSWLGLTDEQFYNPELVAILPMDFYYPGKAKHGDLPPRKGFAEKWHPRLLDLMPDVQLVILIGMYAQRHYLGNEMKRSLTETVHSFREYAPDYFPIVHPSPLNFRWQTNNPWFKDEVVPALQERVQEAIHSKA